MSLHKDVNLHITYLAVYCIEIWGVFFHARFPKCNLYFLFLQNRRICCVFFYCYQHNSKLTFYSLLNLAFLLTFLQENERETPYRPSYLLDWFLDSSVNVEDAKLAVHKVWKSQDRKCLIFAAVMNGLERWLYLGKSR